MTRPILHALLRAAMLSGLCTPWARAQPLAWSQRALVAGASDPAMAYDSDRHVCVAFVGYDQRAWTMKWNGATWNVRTLAGPGPRYGHMMAYDSARHVTVMFGGANNDVQNNQTWEWNGATWTPRGVGGPVREYGAMAYDSDRRVCVVFGGGNGPDGRTFLAETWEWNGTTWSQRTGPQPSPRTGPGMCYDSTRHVAVLFGGATEFTADSFIVSQETWELGNAGWVLRANSGPSPRGAHAMAFDSRRGVSVLFGGYFSGPLSRPNASDETWEWNGTTWTRRLIAGPAGRAQHAMAFDSFRNVLVLQSGYLTDESEDQTTWELSGTPACAADMDDGTGSGTPDGGVTIDDLLYYLAVFADGNVRADVDDGTGTGTPDGGVTIDDLLYFLQRFSDGC